MKKTSLLALAVVVAAPPALAQTRLSIATGGTGGVYYPWAAASPTIRRSRSTASRPPPR